jgi:UPF0755 protein
MAKKKKKFSFTILLFLMAVFAAGGFYLYNRFFLASVHLKNANYTFIFIDREDTFEDVMNDINSENIIDDQESFKWLAKKMDLEKNIHPGKYRILNGMSMRQIINLIKYNKQEKVRLTFNYQIHDLDEFVAYVDDKLEISNVELEEFIHDEKTLNAYFKLDPENCFTMLVPGVYDVSWAISTEDFFLLLKQNFDALWNVKRKRLAKKIGYDIPDIVTLASIVQSESNIKSEQEKIAGVYINRLKIGMALQADPTLRFANKSFDVRRFWNSDKKIDSPYNTYKYKGLPPGPICLVYPQTIDATLNYAKHRYIYFCAKPSLNGYSDFSTSFEQHQKFALAYQRALAKKGITR